MNAPHRTRHILRVADDAAAPACCSDADALRETTDLLARRTGELSQSSALLQAMLESAPDGIVAFDLQGRVLAVNATFAALLGQPVDELRSASYDTLLAHCAALVKDPEAFVTRMQATFHAPDHRKHDVIEFRDGRTFERTAVPQFHEGACAGVVSYWRDVTEQRRSADAQVALAEQLRQAQKMESLGALSGGIAHDFNNVLGAILGNAELALAALHNEAAVQESLTAICEAGNRAAGLVQQILTFSRQQPHERTPMAIGDTVREAARLLRATIPAGIELTTHIDPAAPLVLADATQVHQIVMNLCTNSMHALQEREHGVGRTGEISIRVEQGCAGEDSNVPGTIPVGPFVRLSIRDNGVGMDEATMARIFEPFFTTRHEIDGTGLGLSVVHGIMETHQGAITVESTRHVGTEFALYFPAIAAAAPAPCASPDTARPADVPAAAAGPVRVLYVDDDELIVSLVSRLLRRGGYRVTGFGRAQDALDAFRAAPDDVDVVITDFNMPEMSGLDITRAVRAIRPELPVVITSGYISQALQDEADACGVQQVLYKPDLAQRLLQIVRDVPAARRTA